jgi:dTDP-4-dehydrorhamnose reductase
LTLLVVGGSGHLGGEVCRQAWSAGAVVVATFGRAAGTVPGVRWERLDITDAGAVAALFTAVRPSTVVNAAYDYASWTVNADGAGHVAVWSARVGARLVHVSTDALHSGRPTPYLDSEPPSPVTSYGAAKAAAETAVRLLDPAAVIVRTSLIMGDAESKQVRLCLDLVAGRIPGALFSDEYRCPIDVSDLAGAVLELAASDYAGLLNVAGPDAVSRVELGRLIAKRYGLDAATVPARTLGEAGLVRPANVRLDITLAQSTLRTHLRGARELLAAR